MDKIVYTGLALRTIKPHSSKEMAILDWSLGLAGEAGEVLELLLGTLSGCRRMEMAKELGDVLWYTHALASELDIIGDLDDLQEVAKLDIRQDSSVLRLVVYVSKVQEMLKHHIMHKEPLNREQMISLLNTVMKCINSVSKLHNFTIEDVAELNIAKLEYRYMKNNGNYSHTASADRHSNEKRFEDTDIYKFIRERIEG